MRSLKTPHQPLRDDYAEVARSLRDQRGESATVDRALELAAGLAGGRDEVAINLARARGRVQAIYATGDRARLAVERQYDLGEGPCLTAIQERETVHLRDLVSDDRWPEWARYVERDLHLGSALCFPLFTTTLGYGALSLFSDRADDWEEADVEAGHGLAAHVAVALASTRQIDNLTRSIESRGTVGIAIGMVMERYDLDRDAAFAFLRRVSNTTNTRLYHVAEHLAETRQVPVSDHLTIRSEIGARTALDRTPGGHGASLAAAWGHPGRPGSTR